VVIEEYGIGWEGSRPVFYRNPYLSIHVTRLREGLTVSATPTISRPFNAKGSDLDWMSVGFWNSKAASAFFKALCNLISLHSGSSESDHQHGQANCNGRTIKLGFRLDFRFYLFIFVIEVFLIESGKCWILLFILF
jgi:hypothetical protein